jgi:hypothetical protein
MENLEDLKAHLMATSGNFGNWQANTPNIIVCSKLSRRSRTSHRVMKKKNIA